MLIHELIEKKIDYVANRVPPQISLRAIAEFFAENNIGFVIVSSQQGELVGIVTEQDVIQAISQRPMEFPNLVASDVMSTELITVTPDDPISDTLALMEEHGIRHIPVMEFGKLVCVIGIHDFRIVCEHLGKLALTDSLTGLPNRREFMKAINGEFNRYKRFEGEFSLASMDIDFFKKINDVHGHNAGDMVLSKFADLFRARLRPYDVAARLGGEEFGLLFPNTDLECATLICEDILKSIREVALWADTGEIRVTASFGVTFVSSAFETVDAMLKYSDDLLYQAKNSGRNTVVAKLYDRVIPPMENQQLAATG